MRMKRSISGTIREGMGDGGVGLGIPPGGKLRNHLRFVSLLNLCSTRVQSCIDIVLSSVFEIM